jgi:hypothetical protein
LQGGLWQTVVTEDRTGDRLQRRLGETVSELDDVRGHSAAAHPVQLSQDHPQLLLRGPVEMQRGVSRDEALAERGDPGEVDHRSRHGGYGQAEDVADMLWL